MTKKTGATRRSFLSARRNRPDALTHLHARARRTRNTAELRKLARNARREILTQQRFASLVSVADGLFRGTVVHRGLAVLLLEGLTDCCGDVEFRLFEGWLGEVDNWGDHDGVVHYLIGPMVAREPRWLARVFAWANSPNRWKRRAAAVALIQATRKRQYFGEVRRLTAVLRNDQDDMVQKGLAWLLRETAKADPRRTTSFLMANRSHLPRLVLRTACEKLQPETRARILAK